jgi:hypothetical protein
VKFVLVLPLLLGSLAVALGSDQPPAPPLDSIVKASEYGDKTVWSYEQQDNKPLPWTLFKPNDFATVPTTFDGTGVRDVGEVPPPDVHPRIFFSPDDLPALRKRLKETHAGQEAYKNVLEYANALKMTYDEKADYAQPDWMAGNFSVHGRCPVFRIGSYKNREDYFSELADGKKPSKDFNWYGGMTAEAFRALIENDAEAGQKVIRALITAINIDHQGWGDHMKFSPEGYPPYLTHYPPRSNGMGTRSESSSIGMIYDFTYNWMTPEQRKIIHDDLVLRSAWEDNYGTFNNADASRSNFATFSHFLYDSLAIEGEAGYNDLKVRGLYRGWRNFYSTSFFESGAIYEGEGKSLLGMDATVAFTRLAKKYNWQPLAWHPTPRNHFGNFTPLSVLPTQDAFAIFDLLGGVNNPSVCKPEDVMIAHYLYPDNKRLDMVYRMVVGDDFRNLPNRPDGPQNNTILAALFATDFDPTNTPEKLGMPNTFFCGQRAMMLTRSSWDKDASFLTFHERGASGGHPYRDRNGIMFTGKGRAWVTIPNQNGEYNAWMCNTALIEGCEPNNTTPGRVVDFKDNPLATFIVGDAKYCWDWSWLRVNKTTDDHLITVDDLEQKKPLDFGPAMQPVEQCFNDFAYTKIHSAEYDRPLKEERDWVHVDGFITPYLRMFNTPVLKAFRTAGLVRGPHPYALIVDDFQRDAFPAKYNWNLTMLPDVQLVKGAIPGALPGDVVLAGQGSLAGDGSLKPGEPALLIRPLEMKGRVQAPILSMRQARRDASASGIVAQFPVLTLSTLAASPDFKIMLYAFRNGEPLPHTKWDEGHANVSVRWADQNDQLEFSAGSAGKTNVRVTRDNQELVAMTAPVPHLNDPGSDALTASLNALPKKMNEMQNWDISQVPGLVASWRLDKLVDGKLPADQSDVPAFDGPGATIENSSLGSATRFSADGGHCAFSLKGKVHDACSFSFWVKSDLNPNEHLLDIGSLGMEIHGSLWVSASHHNAFAKPIAVGMLEEWTHYVLVFDKLQVTMYCNGRPVFAKSGDHGFEPNDTVRLGHMFKGVFRDLRIYSTALDADTVQKMYLKGYYLYYRS